MFDGLWDGQYNGLWLGEEGVTPVVIFPRGGHNDDDEVMAIVMSFMGVIANGRT